MTHLESLGALDSVLNCCRQQRRQPSYIQPSLPAVAGWVAVMWCKDLWKHKWNGLQDSVRRSNVRCSGTSTLLSGTLALEECVHSFSGLACRSNETRKEQAQRSISQSHETRSHCRAAWFMEGVSFGPAGTAVIERWGCVQETVPQLYRYITSSLLAFAYVPAAKNFAGPR